MRILKKLLILGTALSCPLVFSSCDFSLKNINYFHQSNDLYRVNLNISEACSSNSIYKRKIENITLNIFKHDQKILSLNFDEGFWMPSQSKFRLKNKMAFNKGCLAGTKAITLNLTKKYLNSLGGVYLNLNSGLKQKIKCKELHI